MGQTLTSASVLTCPHGGQITITAANPASADGVSAATAADSFQIAGCPFTTPAGTPSPCMAVSWSSPGARVSINGKPTLSTSSTGVCIGSLGPQGPVVISSTQASVSSS